MLAERDRKVILKYAQKYRLAAVVLFGSSLHNENARDIDLGIKGIDPEFFFEFCWEVYSRLSKPADIINLDRDNSFNRLIEQEGKLIRLHDSRG